MFLNLFQTNPPRVFRGTRGRKSPFGHTWGGGADYSGLRAFRGQPPVHLLFRFNSADPAVGIKLPRTTWLPLLCAIRYGACNLGYRVISDHEVKILHQENRQALQGDPYDEFPEKLPPKSVALRDTRYNPDNPRHALICLRVFGDQALTPKQFAKVSQYVVDKNLRRHDYQDVSVEEFVRDVICTPFIQGPPVDACPNRSCPNRRRKQSLRTLAVFQEALSFDEKSWKKADKVLREAIVDLQIIYQICPLCQAISVTAQGT